LSGPIAQQYELQTNDPQNPIIRLTVRAHVKPLPAFVKRILTAEVEFGEIAAGFRVWPTLRPTLLLERGEKLDITLRFRPQTGSTATLALGPDAPAFCKLRHDQNSNTYWLDITAGPVDASVKRAVPLVVTDPNGTPIKLAVNLSIDVPPENVIVTPSELDLGEVALSRLKAGQQKVGRAGIRKLVGTFRIRALSSTLPFLTLEQQTIVEGINYIVRTRFDLDQLPKAGAYSGSVVIETDDGNRFNLPVKLTIVDR
jgi:hypothetical protein